MHSADDGRKKLEHHIRVDYSSITATAPIIQILPSYDRRSLGLFITLAFGERSFMVVSSQSDFDSSLSLSLHFPAHLQQYFEQSSMVFEPLFDISNARRNPDISLYCIGQCKYGTAIHPLFQFNAISHEIYCILCRIYESPRYYYHLSFVFLTLIAYTQQ